MSNTNSGKATTPSAHNARLNTNRSNMPPTVLPMTNAGNHKFIADAP